ncbi:nuclease [Cupriavidus sp. SHE]|jgi:endonuclease G, mitochondrial|uniref:Nuclease n=1 Tax=Cupriavidus metallidurans TaxID=119219 RepID=A0A482IPR1_9BURK|nr:MULTISPECIES: DNA/RNA non-specific endonuclease [Cupriavidus]KWR84322.1 nuclease [Cupriavidus sp. SHE]QBP09926.1 nuclease [Cupriavidus metallidurans]
MMNNDRLEALKRRLTPEMETAVRAAFDAGRLPRSLMSAMSRSSVDALSGGQALESVAVAGVTALEGLEAIVALVGRPPLLIRNNTVVLEPMPELPQETPSLIKRVEKWVPSVGRIEFRNHQMAWGGTGWVIEHKKKGALVVTNRHVAQIVARRKADGSAVFVRAPSGARYGAAIDFGEEVESKVDDNSRTAELTRVEYLADDTSADVALLWIEAASFSLPSPFQLAGDKVKVAKGDLVALIGYPAYDSRNDANAQARYFRDLYEVKRFAPGKILQSPSKGVLTYDCTSLGGNSGSPLIRLDDGKVIGLHFSGVYGKENTAVSAKTLSELLKGARSVFVPQQASQDEATDGSHTAEKFEGREGFNTKFLKKSDSARAVATPWPGLPTHLAEGLAEPSDSPPEANELRYTHFGVKYSGELKLPLVTGVNIDGTATVRIKRSADRWFADERIPKSMQLNATNFRDPEIDRGHMVRREDPNWGADAQQANDDTFHYVNAAAQHSRLNQGKALWQGLENYILDSARTYGFKACVFTGPILRDPKSEDDEIEIDGAIAPLEFWKLVATLDAKDKALHATAYILSQGQLIRDLLEKRSRTEVLEGFVLGGYRTFQVAISDLAEATGYDFSAYVKADPLFKSTEGREAIKRGEPVFLPIVEVTDVVL